MKDLSKKNFEKYSRQLIMEKVGIKGQKKIMNSSICIIGCGGLGTTTANYLAMTGVQKMLLVDFDIIEISNLSRQLSFLEKDIGKSKAEVLKDNIEKINPDSKIYAVKEEITKKNIHTYANKFEFIIDCTDNFKSKFLINEYCIKKKKILISAALQNFEIQISTFKAWANKNYPCYECIFPKFSNANNMNCDQMGIISPVAGLGGIMQAINVINIILGCDNDIFKELVLFDCFSRNFKKIRVNKNLQCKVCKN